MLAPALSVGKQRGGLEIRGPWTCMYRIKESSVECFGRGS